MRVTGQLGSVRAAVHRGVYPIVMLPPPASVVASTPASISSRIASGSRVRTPLVGSWSSHSWRVEERSQPNFDCSGSPE